MFKTTRLLAAIVGLAAMAGPALALAQADVEPVPLDAVTTLATMIRWGGLAASVLVVAGAWLVLRLLARLVDRLGATFVERRLVLQKVNTFLRFAVYLATIVVTILLSFRISPEVLAILGGTAAVAIGFATKDLVSSFVAGLMIMLDRPFQVGDRVQFAGEYGDVIEIGMRSVKLRTLGDSVVTIPNNMLLTEVTVCQNYGELDMHVDDVLPAALQDEYHVECGAAAHAEQYHFHGSYPQVLSAVLRRPVHDHGMAAAGFTDEGHVIQPFHRCFHSPGAPDSALVF